MITFNISQAPISTQAVWEALNAEPIRPWKVKELVELIGLDTTEHNIKDVSNRCGYLIQKGYATRIAMGTYLALDEKGRNMTMTETTPGPPRTPLVCEECGFESPSPMGLKAHITRSHKKAGKLNVDEAFERVAQATKILFPDPEDIYSKFEEIGQLRKEMLKAISR